jgi:hypothetical protein
MVGYEPRLVAERSARSHHAPVLGDVLRGERRRMEVVVGFAEQLRG